MYYAANTTRRRHHAREPLTFRQQFEKLDEWTRKPMTGKAEAGAAFFGGGLMFLLFFAVYMIA